MEVGKKLAYELVKMPNFYWLCKGLEEIENSGRKLSDFYDIVLKYISLLWK